jgi:predicted site-specific integrase-resolvase
MKKLSEYAKDHNVCYRTAHNHFKQGLITGAYQLPSGTIVIPDNITQEKTKKTEYIVTYSRVSSSENKNNLINQSKRLIDYCSAKGWITKENIIEIGSGINDNRPKLIKLLQEGKVTKLVVEHKDRLTRFGFNYIKTLCDKINCEIIILNNVEEKEDIIQDFISIITSFCAKIYGQRRSKRNTEKLIKQLTNDKIN